MAQTNAPGAFTIRTAKLQTEYVKNFWGFKEAGFKFIFIDESAIIKTECKKKAGLWGKIFYQYLLKFYWKKKNVWH